MSGLIIAGACFSVCFLWWFFDGQEKVDEYSERFK